MKAAGRQLRIRELLDGQEFVDLETLCRELETSEASVRRDLIALESEGILKRVYGGAMAVQSRVHGFDFEWQSTRMPEEKRRIGGVAAALVENGQTIILDGGSTTAAVARSLKTHSCHVITNSLPIAGILEDAREIEVTLTGGYLDPRLRATLGPICEQMLRDVRADVLIMGIGGITEEGFSNNNTLAVGPERQMIACARRVVIVTDHTKFGRGAVIHVAPLEIADIVVTDAALALEHEEMLRSRSVEVLRA